MLKVLLKPFELIEQSNLLDQVLNYPISFAIGDSILKFYEYLIEE